MATLARQQLIQTGSDWTLFSLRAHASVRFAECHPVIKPDYEINSGMT